MNEYTPTTEEVRGAYHAWSDGQGDNFDEKPTWSFQEFDRWFASEIAKAEARGRAGRDIPSAKEVEIAKRIVARIDKEIGER